MSLQHGCQYVTTDSTARVKLLDREDVPEDYQYLLDPDVLGELNLFRAMAHAPEALQSYMRYGTALWNCGDFSTRERELAILAVSATKNATYEWNQHVEIGRKAGISDSELAAIARIDYAQFTEREQAIMRYAVAVATGSVNDPLFEAASEVLDQTSIIGLTLLACHYVQTERFFSALSIPLDDEFVGWDPTNR